MPVSKRSTNWLHSRSHDGAPFSGDFVEHVQLAPRVQAIVVGDVVGHGLHPSVAARRLKGFVQSLLFEGVSPGTLLMFADRYFTQCIMEESIPFASLFVAISDLDAGTLCYASAGHETALLFESSGAHAHLGPTGPLLGLGLQPSESIPFPARSSRISESAMLVVVTDGITDARQPERDESFFGSAGVVRAVSAALNHGDDPARAVHEAATAHAKRPLGDDASVVITSFAGLRLGRDAEVPGTRTGALSDHGLHAPS